jgi:hypothetical protein
VVTEVVTMADMRTLQDIEADIADTERELDFVARSLTSWEEEYDELERHLEDLNMEAAEAEAAQSIEEEGDEAFELDGRGPNDGVE